MLCVFVRMIYILYIYTKCICEIDINKFKKSRALCHGPTIDDKLFVNK